MPDEIDRVWMDTSLPNSRRSRMPHNDHLQEPTLERTQGKAEGVYYKGVGAVMQPGFVIVAPDLESLREIWGRLTEIPLNEEKIGPLAIFSQSNVKE